MGKPRAPQRPVGRPATGIRPGEKASEYRRFTLRLPPETVEELDAASRAVGRPQWRVVADAIKAYIGTGPVLADDERRAVRVILKLHQ